MFTKKRSGFTLIELLVVIAIIAILAAILFPVFARARESARKSTCQSNMKECAVALNQYWNDYDSKIPSAAVSASNASVAISDKVVSNFITGNDTTKVSNLVTNALPPSSGQPKTTWAQIMWANMKSKEIVFCPSDSSKDLNPIPMYSYWWKPAADLAWRDNTINAQKEGDFAYNADQIIFFERAGFHSGENGIKGGTQINVAFMDSHVKTIAIPNVDCPGGESNANVLFNNPAAVHTTEGEPMFYNYNNDWPGADGIPNADQKGHVPPQPGYIYTDANGNKTKGIDPRVFSDKL